MQSDESEYGIPDRMPEPRPAIEPDSVTFHPDTGTSHSAQPYCPECGQVLDGRTAGLSWEESAPPKWAWGLIVVGVVLVVIFGPMVWYEGREARAMYSLLQLLPTGSARLEGPSVKRAAMRFEVPLDTEGRYAAAMQNLNRALVGSCFGLAALVPGIGMLARRSVRHTNSPPEDSSDRRPSHHHPVIRLAIDGWALGEGAALSTFHLLTLLFLFLLSTRVVAGEPPTWGVVRGVLDRMITIVLAIPDLIR